MTDQERLNSIKQKHEKAIQQPIITATVHPNDANWLIQQAERAEILKQRNKRGIETSG